MSNQEILPPAKRVEGRAGAYRGVPRQKTQDDLTAYKVENMAQAMEVALQRTRAVENEDPDAYGYLQEVENELQVDLLDMRWKAKPDDEIWVKRLRARARKATVAKLFLEGHKVPEIAKLVQTSEVTIMKDLGALSNEWRRSYLDDIELLAGKDLERLETYLVALAPGISRGDTKSIVAAVEIIKERGSILGYRQGVQVNIEEYVREVASANGFDPDRAVEIASRISVTMKL